MNIIKRLIKKLISLPFVWVTIGSLIRRKGVVVLMYHRVTEDKGPFSSMSLEKFREQMKWLNHNCNVLHPAQFSEKLTNLSGVRPSVLLTFDDGQRCVHDVIYPVLKELDIPAIVFLATNSMDNAKLIWTDELSWAVKESKQDYIHLPWDPDNRLMLSTIEDKNYVAGICKNYLKQQPDKVRRNLYSKLLEILDAGDPYETLQREMLNWDEVRACRDVFEYGGHTHNHPIMSRLDNDDLEFEIATCRNRMSDELGVSPTTFAYPNGEMSDYNEACKESLKKNGFETAFTTVEGINNENTDLFELRRIPTGGQFVEDLAWMILRA